MKLSSGFFFFLFLFSSLAHGEMDYSGFLRVRGVLSPVHKLDSVFLNQTLHLKGVLQPNERFHTSFWFRSSPEWGALNAAWPFQIYARGDWNINRSFTLRMGTGPYDTALHQVFSQNDYESYPSLFQGVFLSYSTDASDYHLWGGYFPNRWQGDGKTDPAPENPENKEDLSGDLFSSQVDGGKYSLGINVDIKVVSAFLNRALFHWVYLSNSLTGDSEQTTRLGFSLQGQITRFNMDYSVLTVFHGKGLGFRFNEDMQHISLGYSKAEWLDSYFFAGYHRDSSHYDPWLYDRHENGGLLDILQWGNLTYWLAGYKASVWHWFDMELRYYLMQSTTDEGPVRLGLYGSYLTDKDALSASGKSLGWEMDLRLIKDITEEFRLTLLGGVFVYDEELKSALGKGDKYYSQLQLSARYIF